MQTIYSEAIVPNFGNDDMMLSLEISKGTRLDPHSSQQGDVAWDSTAIRMHASASYHFRSRKVRIVIPEQPQARVLRRIEGRQGYKYRASLGAGDQRLKQVH